MSKKEVFLLFLFFLFFVQTFSIKFTSTSKNKLSVLQCVHQTDFFREYFYRISLRKTTLKLNNYNYFIKFPKNYDYDRELLDSTKYRCSSPTSTSTEICKFLSIKKENINDFNIKVIPKGLMVEYICIKSVGANMYLGFNNVKDNCNEGEDCSSLVALKLNPTLYSNDCIDYVSTDPASLSSSSRIELLNYYTVFEVIPASTDFTAWLIRLKNKPDHYLYYKGSFDSTSTSGEVVLRRFINNPPHNDPRAIWEFPRCEYVGPQGQCFVTYEPGSINTSYNESIAAFNADIRNEKKIKIIIEATTTYLSNNSPTKGSHKPFRGIFEHVTNKGYIFPLEATIDPAKVVHPYTIGLENLMIIDDYIKKTDCDVTNKIESVNCDQFKISWYYNSSVLNKPQVKVNSLYTLLDPCCKTINYIQLFECDTPTVDASGNVIDVGFRTYKIRGMCDQNSNSNEYLILPQFINPSKSSNICSLNRDTNACFRIFIEDNSYTSS